MIRIAIMWTGAANSRAARERGSGSGRDSVLGGPPVKTQGAPGAPQTWRTRGTCMYAPHRRCWVSACAPCSSQGGSGLSHLSALAWEAGPLAVEGRPGLGAGVVIHSLRLWAVAGQRVDPARADPWPSPVTVLQAPDERRAGSLWVALFSEYSTKTPLVHGTLFKSFLLVWYCIDNMKFTILTITKCGVQWH